MLAPTQTPKSFKRLALEFICLVFCTFLLWLVLGYVRFGVDALALPAPLHWGITALFAILGSLWIIAPWIKSFFQKQALMKAEKKALRENNQQEAAFAAQLRLQHHLHQTCQQLKRVHPTATAEKANWFQARLAQLRGHTPLYAQPWYLVLGQAGTGKTNLITQGGAKPIALPGPQAVNWYQSRGALFLEAPGIALSSSNSAESHTNNDHNALQPLGQNLAKSLGNTIGKALKKYRAQQPLNGIILVISAKSLSDKNQKSLQQLAEQTQHTIAALTKQTRTHVPVHIVLSQMDALPGFQAYFAGLSPAERALTWGFSMNASSEKPLSQCIEQLDQLEAKLLHRLVDAMHSAKNPETCEHVQGFPNQFSQLRHNLQNFLTKLIAQPTKTPAEQMAYGSITAAPNNNQIENSLGTIALNSLYFTSAKSPNHSFFVQQLLQQNLLAKAWQFGRNEKAKQTLQWTRATAWLGLGAFSTACMIAWGVGLHRHNTLITQTQENLKAFHSQHETVQTLLTQSKDQRIDAQRLTNTVATTMLPIENAMAAYQAKAKHSQFGLRLAPGKPVALLNSLYEQSLQNLFLPTLMNRLTQTLEQEMAGFERTLQSTQLDDLGQGQLESLLSAFRVYRMMGNFSQRDINQITTWWQGYWAQQIPAGLKDEALAKKQAHWMQQLTDLLALHTANPTHASVDLNKNLVSRSQNLLQQIPPATRLYADIQQAPQFRNVVPFEQQLHPSAKTIFRPITTKPITALYTKAGYDALDLSADTNSINQLSADAWLYEQNAQNSNTSNTTLKQPLDATINSTTQTNMQPAQISATVEAEYLQDYRQTWSAYIGQYRVRKFDSINSLVQALSLLSTEQYSPFAQVIKQVNAQTQLTPSANIGNALGNTPGSIAIAGNTQATTALAKTGRAALTAAAPTPTLVDNHFAPLHQLTGTKAMVDAQGLAPLQALMLDLKNLQNYLNKIKLAQDGGKTAFAMAQQRIQGSGSADAIAQLQLRADVLPAPVNGWVSTLTEQSWQLMLNDAMRYINKQWQSSVYTPYRQQLAGRYPFNRTATRDANLAEFDAFFSPEGVQAAFVTKYLSPFIDTNTWQVKTLSGRGLPISKTSITQLKSAANLRKAFYSQDKTAAAFEFELKPLKLDGNTRRFVLAMGNRELSYSHGPRIAQKLQWPADNARIEYNFFNRAGSTTGQSYEGNWALFRAFDAAGIRQRENRNKTLAFRTQTHLAQYQLTTNTTYNPFQVGFSCPQQL